MFGGSEWLFSAGTTLGGTMGQQVRERHMRAVVIQPHRVMAVGEHIGKILLLPSDPVV
jgi:hypothetical protein